MNDMNEMNDNNYKDVHNSGSSKQLASMPVPESEQFITAERLKKMLPKGSSAKVTEEVLESIRRMEEDTGLPQNHMEEHVMSYMHLIGNQQGIGVMDLINAIKYCNLKRNMTNVKAWSIVFPKKYKELTDAGKDTSNFVSMYNSTKLVVAIDKELIVPTYINYSAYFHEAIETQYKLMKGTDANGASVSAMVQHLAAKELMDKLKIPEEKSIAIKVGASDSLLAAQHELANSIASLVASQKEMFKSGASVQDIQKIHLNKAVDEAIDAELDEDEREYAEMYGEPEMYGDKK